MNIDWLIMTRGSLLFIAYASPCMVHLSLFMVGSSVLVIDFWGADGADVLILWKDVLLVLIRRRNDTKRTSIAVPLLQATKNNGL